MNLPQVSNDANKTLSPTRKASKSYGSSEFFLCVASKTTGHTRILSPILPVVIGVLFIQHSEGCKTMNLPQVFNDATKTVVSNVKV
jgi:hypothetical protein